MSETMARGLRARLTLRHPGFVLDVDLHLPGRGVTALFGASGSGKTSLLRCLAGLERPSGEVRINGEVWQDRTSFVPTHRRSLGYVFQEASLFSHLTVRGNLDYALRRATCADSSKTASIIHLLGIAPLLGRQPAGLSGGERQRVAIARALLTQPRLLLLDEPLAALDLPRKEEILPYLQRLHDDLDIPMLYVSHSPDEVARLADHLVVLDGGRAVAAGPLAETLARLDLPIRLGEEAGVVMNGVVEERHAQWHLARVRCDGVDFWARDGGHPLGQGVRIRILARDVSIALGHTTGSSILNILPAEVVEIGADPHPAQAMVKLRVGASSVLARVTHRSVAALRLAPGSRVFAQIKAVALIA